MVAASPSTPRPDREPSSASICLCRQSIMSMTHSAGVATTTPPPSHQPKSPVKPAAATPGGDRVLVVDDEPLIRGTLAELLEQEGYAVTPAADAAEALARAAEQPFALALCDIQ